MKLCYNGSIYITTNVINHKVYIGQTKKSIDIRKGEHIRNANNSNRSEFNTRFYRAIRKYGAVAFEFKELITLKASSKENLQYLLDTLEVFYIKQYAAINPETGYNTLPGGRGVFDYNKHKEYLINLSNRMRGENNPFYHKNHSEETKEIMSLKAKERYRLNGNPLKGKKRPKELCDKLSEIFKGRPLKISDAAKKLGIKRAMEVIRQPIVQIDNRGNIVNRWESATEAARSLGFNRTNINGVLRGRNKTAHGYYWIYANDEIFNNYNNEQINNILFKKVQEAFTRKRL